MDKDKEIKNPSISLKNLLVPSKEVETEFPGMPGFMVKVSFLSRESLQTIRKKSTSISYKARQPVENFDEDIFVKLYTAATIKGWSGLKLKYLAKLAPIDISGLDSDMELEYTPEEGENLMRSSSSFDNFVSDFIGDLGNFSRNK